MERFMPKRCDSLKEWDNSSFFGHLLVQFLYRLNTIFVEKGDQTNTSPVFNQHIVLSVFHFVGITTPGVQSRNPINNKIFSKL